MISNPSCLYTHPKPAWACKQNDVASNKSPVLDSRDGPLALRRRLRANLAPPFPTVFAQIARLPMERLSARGSTTLAVQTATAVKASSALTEVRVQPE